MLLSLDCSGTTLLARVPLRGGGRPALTPGMALFALVKLVAFDQARLLPPKPAA